MAYDGGCGAEGTALKDGKKRFPPGAPSNCGEAELSRPIY